MIIKVQSWILSALLVAALMLLAACQGAPAPEPTGTSEPAAPTATPPAPTATLEAYPLASPTPAQRPADYPAPAAPSPASPYPGGDVAIVLRPLGQQCADPASYEFATLDEAVWALEEAGITVIDARIVSLIVCEACDCPTSEHFEVEIPAADVSAAAALGFEVQP